MSIESLPRRRRRSKPVKDQSVPKTAFGRCVIAIAPIKPARWLADQSGHSERHCNRLIDGTRKVSARALAAVIDALLGL
jgi:hypothetical protein